MNTFERALSVAQAMAETEDYLTSSIPSGAEDDIPQGRFSENVHISYGLKNTLEQYNDNYETVDELLDASWAAALKAQAIRYYEGKLIFPVDAMRGDGETPLEVSFRKGDPERSNGRLWFVSYVNTYVHPAGTSANIPSKAIEQFAWMGPWESFLEDLAAVALPESWSFEQNPIDGRRYGILKNYICNTFYRLNLENKICIAQDRSFAAFNSGLVDARFDDIYLCFEPQMGSIEWQFCGFAASGNRALKKRVIKHFSPLPQTARYFDKIEDLLFDPERDLVIDYEHVLIDNIDRLPLEFLARELFSNAEIIEVIEAIKASSSAERESLYEQLSDIVETDSRVYRTLRNRLEDAIDIAKRRVRWNFKTAIPSYYPRANSMSLLLPLCLIDEHRADAALVVQLQDSGAYQGQTILTIEQAYINARLICRPDSDWLTTRL